MRSFRLPLALLAAILLAGCLDETPSGIVWSPDGTALAWIRDRDVMIQDFTLPDINDQRLQIEMGSATAGLTWLPNSEGLIVAALSEESDTWKLVRIGRNGGTTDLRSASARMAAPIVDPGGRLVIHAEFTLDGIATVGWLTEGIDGGTSQSVFGEHAPLIGGEGDTLPMALSDDGRHLVLLRHRDGEADLWVHDFELGAERRLTDDSAVETLVRWLPHSTSILWATQEGRRGSVWVADVTNPDPDRIWHGDAVVSDAEWSPSGEEVFLCAGGQLHRMTDRGRRHQVWNGLDEPFDELSVTPDGERLALTGQGEPILLGMDWDLSPHAVSGRIEDEIRVVGDWAERAGGVEMTRTFGSWAVDTFNDREQAMIRRRYGEALSRAGDHEGALEQYSIALRLVTPADPDLHRLVGEEMLLHVGDFNRARVALNNAQAEVEQRARQRDEDPPPISLTLAILRTEDASLIRPCALHLRAVSERNWRVAAVAFQTLAQRTTGMSELLVSHGLDVLSQMNRDLPGSAEAVRTMCSALATLPLTVEERNEVEGNRVLSLLTGRRYDEAAEELARMITDDHEGETLRLVASAMREALSDDAQGLSPDIAIFGRQPAITLRRLWASPALEQALDEAGTPAERLAIAATQAHAALMTDDAEALEGARQRVIRLVEDNRDLDPPTAGFQAAAFVETLRGYQGLRDGDINTAHAGFRAAEETFAQLAGASPAAFAENGGRLARTAISVVERRMLLESIDPTPTVLGTLRSEWLMHGFWLWGEALPSSLPLPASPHRPLPDFEEGPPRHIWRLAEDLGRAVDRLDSPPLRDHERLNRARMLALCGDWLSSISLLRSLTQEATLPVQSRAALLELALMAVDMSDHNQARDALQRLDSLDPTPLESAIAGALLREMDSDD